MTSFRLLLFVLVSCQVEEGLTAPRLVKCYGCQYYKTESGWEGSLECLAPSNALSVPTIVCRGQCLTAFSNGLGAIGMTRSCVEKCNSADGKDYAARCCQGDYCNNHNLNGKSVEDLKAMTTVAPRLTTTEKLTTCFQCAYVTNSTGHYLGEPACLQPSLYSVPITRCRGKCFLHETFQSWGHLVSRGCLETKLCAKKKSCCKGDLCNSFPIPVIKK